MKTAEEWSKDLPIEPHKDEVDDIVVFIAEIQADALEHAARTIATLVCKDCMLPKIIRRMKKKGRK